MSIAKSNIKLNKLSTLISLLAANLGLMFIVGSPAMAREVGARSENEHKKPDIVSWKENAAVSTQAIDLLTSKEEQRTYLDNSFQVNKIAQKDLDLKQFCQDYPYNSQCKGTNPSNTIPESESTPVRGPSPKQQKSGWAIVPEISTQGVGGHLVRKIVPQLNARVGVNAIGLGLDIKDTDIDYEGDLNLLNVSTILDYHPVEKSGFKLSAGLIFADNNIKGTADTDLEGTVNLGNDEFSSDQLDSVDVEIDITRNVAPYVGLGWGNAVAENKGLGFWLNAGVMFGGSLKAEVTPNINGSIPPEIEARIRQEADQEQEDLEDEINFLSVYPVAALGISYQF